MQVERERGRRGNCVAHMQRVRLQRERTLPRRQWRRSASPTNQLVAHAAVRRTVRAADGWLSSPQEAVPCRLCALWPLRLMDRGRSRLALRLGEPRVADEASRRVFSNILAAGRLAPQNESLETESAQSRAHTHISRLHRRAAAGVAFLCRAAEPVAGVGVGAHVSPAVA